MTVHQARLHRVTGRSGHDSGFVQMHIGLVTCSAWLGLTMILSRQAVLMIVGDFHSKFAPQICLTERVVSLLPINNHP